MITLNFLISLEFFYFQDGVSESVCNGPDIAGKVGKFTGNPGKFTMQMTLVNI